MANRVLIVDDSVMVASVIAQALRRAGFEVEIAHDLSDFERDPPPTGDLVLMDVVLQEAFGDDIATLLRSTGHITGPVLLMSSLPEDELAARCAEAGLDGYVSKHHGVHAIVERVRLLLGQPAAPLGAPAASGLELEARQRLRRVRYFLHTPARWNSSAAIAEMLALAGDADLAQAGPIAAAARACAEATRQTARDSASAEVRASFEAARRLVGPPEIFREPAATVLVLDDGAYARTHLIPHLDRTRHVVFEARTEAEARQKLRLADYDLVVVGTQLAAMEPELRAQSASMQVLVIDAAVAPADVCEAIDRALDRALARTAR